MAILLLYVPGADAATFLQARSEEERCGALRNWINTFPLARMTGEQEDIVTSLLMMDAVFIPHIGKPYGSLSKREASRIEENLRKCFPDDGWVSYRLTKPFGSVAPGGHTTWEQYFAAMRAPVEVPLLGVEVEQGFSANGRYFVFGAWVARVRKGGPAFLAGIQPGDMITQVGRIEIRKPDVLAPVINKNYKAGGKAQVRTEIYPEGAKTSVEHTYTLILEETDGEWLGMETVVDPSRHDRDRPDLPGRAEALADLRQQSKTAQAEALAEIHSEACALTKERLAELVEAVVLLVGKLGEDTYLIDDQFGYAAKVACDNKRTGLLPDFEVWLLLVLYKAVDPCEQSAELPAEAAQKMRSTQSRAEYDRLSLETALRAFLRGHPEAEPCVLDQIEERVLGRGRFLR